MWVHKTNFAQRLRFTVQRDDDDLVSITHRDNIKDRIKAQNLSAALPDAEIVDGFALADLDCLKQVDALSHCRLVMMELKVRDHVWATLTAACSPAQGFLQGVFGKHARVKQLQAELRADPSAPTRAEHDRLLSELRAIGPEYKAEAQRKNECLDRFVQA
jgi:hypothetical protein